MSSMRLGLRLVFVALLACGGSPPESNDPTITPTGAGTGSSSNDPSVGSLDTSADGPNETCGNGIIEGNEACDHGDQNGVGPCKDDCTLNYCGDGYIAPGEGCDDGN